MPARVPLLVCIGSLLAAAGGPAVAGDGGESADGGVRLLLLAPGGPVVMEAKITIDGRPFRQARGRFVEEVLEAADSNGDGERTWREAIDNPRLAFGRLAWRLRNARHRVQLASSCDRNGDGKVDRREAELLMEAEGDGPAFLLHELVRQREDSRIAHLFDVDGDRVLSKSELQATLDRLKSRDANNNDWLETRELPFVAADPLGGYRTVPRGGVQFTPTDEPQILHLIGPAADVPAIEKQWRRVYGGEIPRGGNDSGAGETPAGEKIPGISENPRNPNGDRNDGVAPFPLARFQTGPAQIAVEVTLGERDRPGRGVAVTSLAAGLKSRAASGAHSSQVVEVDLSGTTLRLAFGVVNRQPPDFDEMADREMKLRDDDENGVLEKGELYALPNTTLAQAFGRWDTDGDGRVSVAEIKADFKREHAVRWSQAEVAAAAEFPTLFNLVDVNADRRLSLREMHEARKRILTLDRNGDGAIAPAERGGTITVVFSRAHEHYSQDIFRAHSPQRLKGREDEGPVPTWFERMDRNQDRDVSRREFLGSSNTFKRIDGDGDGLIDPAEARQSRAREQ